MRQHQFAGTGRFCEGAQAACQGLELVVVQLVKPPLQTLAVSLAELSKELYAPRCGRQMDAPAIGLVCLARHEAAAHQLVDQ